MRYILKHVKFPFYLLQRPNDQIKMQPQPDSNKVSFDLPKKNRLITVGWQSVRWTVRRLHWASIRLLDEVRFLILYTPKVLSQSIPTWKYLLQQLPGKTILYSCPEASLIKQLYFEMYLQVAPSIILSCCRFRRHTGGFFAAVAYCSRLFPFPFLSSTSPFPQHLVARRHHDEYI